MSDSQPMALKRNLIYTGVTRAKKHIAIIGDISAVKKAISNDVTDQRNAKLGQRIAAEMNLRKKEGIASNN